MTNMSEKSISMVQVSLDQRKTMLDFMARHVDFATGSQRTLEARSTSKKLWNELTRAINSFRPGAKKTADGWSKYWSDYKNKLKNKLTMMKKLQKLDGVSSKKHIRLSKLEKKALHILGPHFEKKTWIKKAVGWSHNSVSDQLSAVVKLEASQESPIVSYIPSEWPTSESGENDKNSDVDNNSKNSDDCNEDFADSDDVFEEPMIHGVYPKWLIAIEKKRAEADYIRAKADESRANASTKHAEAALMQAEALKNLATAAHTQAEAIMKIAVALQDKCKRDDGLVI